LTLTKIDMPAQLTGGQKATGARILPAAEVVTDKRIIEIVFHAGMSRSVSFDGDNQDDGMYLVLQPKNQLGQVVPTAGTLAIEAFEVDQQRRSVGQWKYSPSEVHAKMQPIGSQQGIHLTLPWNGPNPKSEKVLVIATYHFENGRKLIAQKEIYLSSGSKMKTVWAPRAAVDASSGTTSQQVIPASASTSTASDPWVQTVGSFPAPESAPAPK
jgi:hypothetical protein